MLGINLLKNNFHPPFPSEKTGSITLLTTAATLHSAACIIQLEVISLLASLLSCLLMLTLHCGNFQWAGRLIYKEISAMVFPNQTDSNVSQGYSEEWHSLCHNNLLVNWC